MSQKTQQGLGPGPSNPFESEDDDVPASERITPVDSERGRMLAKAAEAALREARRSSAPPAVPKSDSDAPVTLDGEVSADAPAEKSRAEFDTVPGGGLNRESGGREAARAYVSPKTPIQLKEGRLALLSVDVAPEASADSRSFPTEKALRAASVVPPPMSTLRPVARGRSLAPYWIAAASAALLSATIAYVFEEEKSPLVTGSPAAAKPASETALKVDSAVASVQASAPSGSPKPTASSAPVATPPAVSSATATSVAPVNHAPSASEEKKNPDTKVSNKPSLRPINKAEPSAPKAGTRPAGTSPKAGSEDVWLE